MTAVALHDLARLHEGEGYAKRSMSALGRVEYIEHIGNSAAIGLGVLAPFHPRRFLLNLRVAPIEFSMGATIRWHRLQPQQEESKCARSYLRLHCGNSIICVRAAVLRNRYELPVSRLGGNPSEFGTHSEYPRSRGSWLRRSSSAWRRNRLLRFQKLQSSVSRKEWRYRP